MGSPIIKRPIIYSKHTFTAHWTLTIVIRIGINLLNCQHMIIMNPFVGWNKHLFDIECLLIGLNVFHKMLYRNERYWLMIVWQFQVKWQPPFVYGTAIKIENKINFILPLPNYQWNNDLMILFVCMNDGISNASTIESTALNTHIQINIPTTIMQLYNKWTPGKRVNCKWCIYHNGYNE